MRSPKKIKESSSALKKNGSGNKVGTSSLPQIFKMEQRKNRGLLHGADISSDFRDSLGLINPSVQKSPGYYLYTRINLFLDAPQANEQHAIQKWVYCL